MQESEVSVKRFFRETREVSIQPNALLHNGGGDQRTAFKSRNGERESLTERPRIGTCTELESQTSQTLNNELGNLPTETNLDIKILGQPKPPRSKSNEGGTTIKDTTIPTGAAAGISNQYWTPFLEPRAVFGAAATTTDAVYRNMCRTKDLDTVVTEQQARRPA